MIMLQGIIKIQHTDAVHSLQTLCQLPGFLQSHITYHDSGRPISNKLLFHQIQPLSGLRSIRQIRGQIIIHLHPVHGKNTEQNQHNKYQIKPFSFIHDQRWQPDHKGILFFTVLLFHFPSNLTFCALYLPRLSRLPCSYPRVSQVAAYVHDSILLDILLIFFSKDIIMKAPQKAIYNLYIDVYLWTLCYRYVYYLEIV